MTVITFDYSKIVPHFSGYEVEFLSSYVRAIHEKLHSDQSIHRDSLVLNDTPKFFERASFARIQQNVYHIQKTSDILLVIGMGGSYPGARTAIDCLTHPFKISLHKFKKYPLQIRSCSMTIIPEIDAKLVGTVLRCGKRKHTADIFG